jgi:hypothetical protein
MCRLASFVLLYPKLGKICLKIQNIPNGLKKYIKGHKIFKKYLLQGLPKYIKNGSLGMKIFHLATLLIFSYVE